MKKKNRKINWGDLAIIMFVIAFICVICLMLTLNDNTNNVAVAPSSLHQPQKLVEITNSPTTEATPEPEPKPAPAPPPYSNFS